MSRWTPTDYNPDDFANRRHIGPSPVEMAEMLKAVGADSLDQLIEQTVPAAIRQSDALDWPALSEAGLLARMREVADKNRVMTSLIGQGYYGTVTPPAIQRNILENPAWYTAYTPYQPEIAQGRLEALLNFQTMVADLTGLPVANASLLDEATAAAEAMAMARRQSKSKADAFFVAHDLHPQTIAVIETRAEPLGIRDHRRRSRRPISAAIDVFARGVPVSRHLWPYPRPDPRDRGAACRGRAGHRRDRPSGAVRAEGAGRDGRRHRRRIVAALWRADGLRRPARGLHGLPRRAEAGDAGAYRGRQHRQFGQPGAYRLSLQTREQHIRREKATSNICTAQALLAVMAGFYAVFHGPVGLRAIAQRVHLHAVTVADALRAAGAEVAPEAFFDTITVKVGVGQQGIMAAARHRGINLRKVGRDRVGISVDETTDAGVIIRLLDAFGITDAAPAATAPAIPEALLRESEYLTHPVFHMNRAESEMMRYMRRLSDRDLALDRTMIPLGSCTMKLNATSEMIPITWPEFANLHPFAPADQAAGLSPSDR